jgi:NAD(P)-dependent dehydrogenase (short-subunit alcohol dehydrogenase family)
MEEQRQEQPGRQAAMRREPVTIRESYRGSGKLEGKIALISGGDSGIGRAVAVHFAREGASCAIVYLEEDEDARKTAEWVEREGGEAMLLRGDIGHEPFCAAAVEKVRAKWGRVDVLVNNAAEQHVVSALEEITAEQLERTFRTNIFGYFFLTKAALALMPRGASIVNSTSVTAYRGSGHLIDYSATKGAIASFTRSLSQALIERGIRVNGVAPGPIRTPLIPASFSEEQMESFGKNTPMGRPGEPAEVAPSYVFLASEDASYITGQIIHPNGGQFTHT